MMLVSKNCLINELDEFRNLATTKKVYIEKKSFLECALN
jgi:hypothetical protein